nr:phasin family protein [uncultured Sphingosinicella sp.]
MADRKVKAGASKGVKANASVLANPAKAPKAPAAAEFTASEPVTAPLATATASLEVAEIVASAPVEVAEPVADAVIEAAETIQTQAQEGTTTMNQQMNDTIEMNREAGRVAADKFQAAFGDVNERTKTAMEKSSRLMEEMTEITRGNVEAIVASSKVAARGVETLTQEAADFGRRSFEEASSTLKSFAEVKSPTDFFRLQSDFARAQFDAMVSETSKMSEAMIKLAGEVAQPITSRYTVAAERVKTIAL